MKMFVNRIVAMAHHYPHNATLEEIALYVSYEIAQPEILDQLASTDINNEERIKDLTTPEFKRALAAIYYGVPKNEADEVLYITGIRNAVDEGDAKNLKTLLENISAQKVCYNYLNVEAYTWHSLDQALKASSAFAEFAPEDGSDVINECVVLIAKRLGNLKDEYFKFNKELNENNVEDLIRLIDFCPEIIPDITRKLSIQMTDDDFGYVNKLEVEMLDWVKTVLKAMKSIKKYDRAPNIYLHLSKEGCYKQLADSTHKCN